MSHVIQIEGSPDLVPVEAGGTILDALLAAGVGFAYSCQSGNCGTCRCELVSGDILDLEYSEHALSPEDRARGQVLACRSQVWGDVVIRRLDDSEFVVHPSRILACRVVRLDRLTHDIWHLDLDIVSGGPFTFSPGQYASVEFPFAPGVARDYSMANRPDEAGLSFYIREMPGGALSARLGERLHPGDTVRVSGPFGSAHLREGHDGPVLAIAGGSGLAPIRSIVTASVASARSGPIHVYFGARREQDVYLEAELGACAAATGGTFDVVLSEEPAAPGAPRRAGLVTDAVEADFDDFTGYKAYVAGPPAMVEAAVAMLRRKGMALRDIHADAFYPAGASPTPTMAVTSP